MKTQVSKNKLMAFGNDSFGAEASCLGWAPGHFPMILDVPDLGNGQQFHRISLTQEKAKYVQECGCVTIVVFND